MTFDPDPRGTDQNPKMGLDPDLEVAKPITAHMIDTIHDFNNHAEVSHFKRFFKEEEAHEVYRLFVRLCGRRFAMLYNRPEIFLLRPQLNNLINWWTQKLIQQKNGNADWDPQS